MNLDEAIAGRRAVREYSTQPVPEQTIRQLVAAAVMAPSAVNEQPWTFTVVRDAALLERISRASKKHLLETMPATAHSERFQAILSDPGYQVFYHAPVLIVVSAPAGPWVVEDCALAAQNLMLSAHALGLGSCWIGFAQYYLNTPEGKQALGLPPGSVAVAPIIVGHPKAPVPAVPRKEPVIRWVG
jgi:nitroreductase